MIRRDGHDQSDYTLTKLLQEKPHDLNNTEEYEFQDADHNEKLRIAEKRYIKTINDHLQTFSQTYIQLSSIVLSLRSANSIKDLINQDVLNPIFSKTNDLLDFINNTIAVSSEQVLDTVKFIAIESEILSTVHNNQHNEFTKLKQKFENHKDFYNRWNSLTKKIDEKEQILKRINFSYEKKELLRSKRIELIRKYNDKKKELFNLRKNSIDSLNETFNGSIKITLTFNGITEEYEQALRNALKGSNMRYNILIPNIVQNFTPDRFAEIIHSKDYETLKKVVGIDIERSDALFKALCETDDIYNIEKIYCSDLPEFLLKIDLKEDTKTQIKENYKKSDELSTGQRCTTVLPIVFAVSNNPLIIDQPEDNLDNKYISDTIHQIIRDKKSIRQLIFITHNPNIPVLSEAEKNYFLGFTNKQSFIENEGSIKDVKNSILNLLEGGKEAFEKREKLYDLNFLIENE